jgi:glyoxylase-like metal-dependent hydrolase (beta-lactamase superfamily II)
MLTMDRGDQMPEGVIRVRADNPSALTLEGTNTYLVDGWVIDPGPPDDEAHVEAVLAAAGGRLNGIAITHAHADHDGAAPALAERAGGVPVVRPSDGDEVGPLLAIATPGHTADHVSFVLDRRVAFTGDAVAGRGSVFIAADGGGLGPYLDGLRRLRELDLEALCPGHGPVVHDPRAKLDEYIDHRLERERKLVAALDQGLREPDDLLDAAWDDVDWSLSPYLRWAAGQTLEAHLQKLRAEGRV